MPTYSQVTITFSNDWVLGDRLKILTYLDNSLYMGKAWTWVVSRSGIEEVTTGTVTGNPGERAAIQFKAAFDLDNPTGYVTTVQNTNEVLIQSETLGELFVLIGNYPLNTGTLQVDIVNDNTDPDSNESNFTALVEKYFIEYCDDFNTDRRVSILQRGFIGVNTELLADVNPISITYESSDDFKFTPIRPSTAEVFMIFDSQGAVDFEEFWTADEKEFMVQDIKDGVVEWVGYVIPNGFQYDFHGGLYYASITASDGLGTLEAIPFVDDNNKPYGNQDLVYNNGFEFPPILILTEILKKLDLDLDLWTCVDNYEKNMTKTGDTRNADPLASCYFNVKTYIKSKENQDTPYWYGSGEEWNCKEVLENLLYIFGAKLYQEFGVWRVKTINADINYIEGTTSLNLLRYSEQANNAYWLKNYVTVSSDAIAVTGTDYFGDKIIESVSVGSEQHYIEGSYEKTASAINYTASVYVKAAELTKIQLKILGASGTGNVRVNFDTATQTLDGSGASSGHTYVSSGYSDTGNGWYRVWVTATSTAETSLRVQVLLFNGIANSYIGDGTSGIYVRGMQLVEGNSATDYYETNNNATQRYWRKYNTVATYLEDYEVIDDEINIPCDDSTKFLIGDSHSMSMDSVYRSFRMNYEYTFLREGDNPLQLIPNGDFCDFNNTSILAAPTDWERSRITNSDRYIRIKDIVIPEADAGGNTCGIEIGTHKSGIPTFSGTIITSNNATHSTSLKTTALPYVNKGDKLFLDIWNKYKYLSDSGNKRYYPIYKLVLYTSTKVYHLVNTILDNKRAYRWEQIQYSGNNGPIWDPSYYIWSAERWFYLDFVTALDGTSADFKTYDWWQFQFELEKTPEAGYIEFHCYGLATDRSVVLTQDYTFKTYQDWETLSNWLNATRNEWLDEGGTVPRLQVTGVSLSVIPNESELPQQQDYIYYNTNTNYTLQTNPITIYNGDVQNEAHVSNIMVPSNVSGGKNFWDDLSGAYGTSSLGLLVVRQIMRQYQKPYRILEGDIKIQDARFGSVYTLSVLPDVRFILQRGTFNKQNQFIENATFIQLSDDVLADGGFEGGDTLDPEWLPTGVTFCELNNFLNTGYVITEEMDMNPNSETYQDTREVVSDAQDLTQCPLNIPYQYYWGSDNVYLNTETLEFAPFTQVSSKEIQISFDNEEGNYLYFVHLKSLGVVERITTPTSPNNVLSDWVYRSDAIIDGYIYRVLRTDYVMTEFTGFIHNFKFA